MKRYLYIAIGIALVLLLVVVAPQLRESSPADSAPVEEVAFVSATLSIEGVLEKSDVVLPAGSTALTLLQETSQEQAFEVITKEYAGMGSLVERIGSVHNGTDGNYWHYYVNGTIAPVGADTYVVQEGDAIEWVFRTPEETL